MGMNWFELGLNFMWGFNCSDLDLMNAWRGLAFGASICHVVRGSEDLGGPRSNEAVKPGGSAKEGPHVRGGSELGSYEDLLNVSRNLVLGGSVCLVLLGSEALGGPRSNAGWVR